MQTRQLSYANNLIERITDADADANGDAGVCLTMLRRVKDTHTLVAATAL